MLTLYNMCMLRNRYPGLAVLSVPLLTAISVLSALGCTDQHETMPSQDNHAQVEVDAPHHSTATPTLGVSAEQTVVASSDTEAISSNALQDTFPDPLIGGLTRRLLQAGVGVRVIYVQPSVEFQGSTNDARVDKQRTMLEANDPVAQEQISTGMARQFAGLFVPEFVEIQTIPFIEGISCLSNADPAGNDLIHSAVDKHRHPDTLNIPLVDAPSCVSLGFTGNNYKELISGYAGIDQDPILTGDLLGGLGLEEAGRVAGHEYYHSAGLNHSTRLTCDENISSCSEQPTIGVGGSIPELAYVGLIDESLTLVGPKDGRYTLSSNAKSLQSSGDAYAQLVFGTAAGQLHVYYEGEDPEVKVALAADTPGPDHFGLLQLEKPIQPGQAVYEDAIVKILFASASDTGQAYLEVVNK